MVKFGDRVTYGDNEWNKSLIHEHRRGHLATVIRVDPIVIEFEDGFIHDVPFAFIRAAPSSGPW